MNIRNVLIAGSMLAALCSGAAAAPVTFFGEDANNGGPPVAPTNSNAARTSFFGNLVGVGTETFDGIAVGTGTPFSVSFPGAGTANITGSGSVTATPNAGRYAISGANYYSTGTGDFTITFSAPIAAFGFFGIDVGDFGGQLSLALTDTLSNVTNLVVPHTVGSGGSNSGSILYFGFYDQVTQYTSISFNNPSTTDAFGFDSFSVGGLQQVTPGVPEAATWAMMLIGFAGLAFASRRRSAVLAV